MSIFIECDNCKAKSGSPILCMGCFTNRLRLEMAERLIDALTEMNAAETEETCAAAGEKIDIAYAKLKEAING